MMCCEMVPIPRSAPERPTSAGLVQQAELEPLPASPSRLSVRRQNESPRSMHGDGPYCYLNNPGFEPCRFQDILGQRAQYGFLAETEAEGLHPADETALAVTHRRELVRKPVLIPVEPGPI